MAPPAIARSTRLLRQSSDTAGAAATTARRASDASSLRTQTKSYDILLVLQLQMWSMKGGRPMLQLFMKQRRGHRGIVATVSHAHQCRPMQARGGRRREG